LVAKLDAVPRNADATRHRIFDAATEEFAAHGIAGARIERIASEAKANKQLIYAYFGDKETLFTQVLSRAVNAIAEAVLVDVEDLDGYVNQLYDYHQQHPELLRLLLWEALEHGRDSLLSESERRAHYQEKVDKIATAQLTGQVTDEVPAGVLMLLLLSLAGWPAAVPQVRRMLVHDADLSEALRIATHRLIAPRK
jgi:AcrR family transcriptional regulator